MEHWRAARFIPLALLAAVCMLVAGCGNMVTRFLSTHEAASRAGTSAWAKKRVLTIDNSTIGQLAQFPLLVKLNPTRIDYSLCASNGADLRFFDADGVTPLDYEIERWNPSSQSVVWVRVPQIDAGSTTDGIIMVYGNSAATAGANPKAVWTTEYKAVYHMVDGNDATANGNNATAVSNVTFSSTAQLGGKGFFDAALTPYMDVPTTGMALGQGTVEAVVEMRTAPSAAQYRFVYSHTNGDNERIYLGAIDAARSFFGSFGNNVGGVTSASTYTLSALTHVSITYSGLNFTMYFNGVQAGTGSAGAHLGILPSARIGNYGAAPNTTWAWDGYIHELRITDTVKSVDYMKANSRAIADTYVTFGAEQEN